PLSLFRLPSLSRSPPPRPLHSFPTRRSSDLSFYARRAVTQVPADQAREDRGRAGEAGEAALGDRAMVRAAQHMKAHPARSGREQDRKSTRLNSSHVKISYAVFCLKKKKRHNP